MERIVELAVKLARTSLPESKLKQFLKGFYERHYGRYLFNRYYTYIYDTDWWMKEVKRCEDGTLSVHLANGMTVYGNPDKVISPWFQFVNRQFPRFDDFKYFYSFVNMLYEQYVLSVYEKNGFSEFGPGNTIVDLGANVGTFTLKAAKIAGSKGRIIAVEPEPENLKLLKKNISINNLDNVTIIPKGIWSEKGQITIHLSDKTGGHSAFQVEYNDTDIDVETDTLDNILTEAGIEKVDFIKMDIEGAELEAIKGMGNTLASSRELMIAAETHHVNGQSTYKILQDFFEAHGFQTRGKRTLLSNTFYGRKTG